MITSKWKGVDGRISDFLQTAANHICRDTPDKLQIGFEDDEMWYRCDTWSAALTRHTQECRYGVYDADLGLGYDTLSLLDEDTVTELIRVHFGHRIQVQLGRHAVAREQGLVQRYRCENLPPERMLIDRTLLVMLEGSGWDIGSAARDAAATKHDWTLGLSEMIIHRAGFGKLCVKQEGGSLPVIHVWHPLGSAKYSGNLLLSELLPETAVLHSVGRRIGELISTGLPALDARRIASVFVADTEYYGLAPWPPEVGTWVTIEPDLVQLGRAAS